jgi:prevent-host-death family protein
MKTISIRELHTRTGHYVRRAATEPITVTDRGATVAILQPAPAPTRVTFAQRRLRPGFIKLQSKPLLGVDSGQIISEDRDAR